MLEENQLEMLKMRNVGKYNAIQKAKRKWILNKIKKQILYGLLIISLFFVLFMPIQSGKIIGKWLNDFFGTIVKESIK